MRSFSETIRDEVWARLREIYMQFTNGNHTITLTQVEQFVAEVLGEKNRDEIGYVTSNLSRLDQDGNGFIEFEEFANFLLKQHCGEIALQKMHRNGRIVNQSVYKITLDEFNLLLNNAYEFLGVHPDPSLTSTLFTQADKDHDGLITYGEYFQFVEKFICRPKMTPVERRDRVEGHRTEFRSRFRGFLWEELMRILSRYDINRSGTVEFSECHRMLLEIFPNIHPTEIEALLKGIFRKGASSMAFEEFANLLVFNLFDRGIAWHFKGKTTLTNEEFVHLLRHTLGFIDIDRVQDILLWRLFDRIDTNGDGLISIEEYLRWVTHFLAVPNYYGSEYIIQDDDYNLALGNDYISSLPRRQAVITAVNRSIPPPVESMSHNIAYEREVVMRREVKTSGGLNLTPFNFSSQELALRVRGHLLRLLIHFDANRNRTFEEEEIIQILITLMKEDRNEIMYVISNVFRYDKNMDRRVTLDELADFFLQSHCGELAIQRLHRKNVYERGAGQQMSKSEFVYTLNYALSFIEIQASPEELSIVFSQIDRDCDGWISYREYFQFLKYYFGSQSYAAIETTVERMETMPLMEMMAPVLDEFEMLLMDEAMPLEERLRLMLKLHLNRILDSYDFDGNRLLTSNEIISLLQTVFGYNNDQIQFVMGILRKSEVLKREEFVDLIVSIHFLQFGFMHNLRMERMGQKDFARILDMLISFLSVRLSPQHYTLLFNNLDVGRAGSISLTQWEAFITRMFGVQNYRNKDSLDEGFYRDIWAEFRRLFGLYDTNNKGYLTEQELELFLREVLLECQHKHRGSVMADLLKLGPVKFDRFASLILARCAETALHRFHLQQPPGKDRLSQREFILLVRSGYEFLRSIDQHLDSLKEIYARLNTLHGDGIDYKTFIDWAYHDIARNVR